MIQKLGLTSSDIGAYLLRGQICYPDEGKPFVWDTSPEIDVVELVKVYEREFCVDSWILCSDPNLELDFSYWYYDKNLDRIMVSGYDVTSDCRCISENLDQKKYPALFIREF